MVKIQNLEQVDKNVSDIRYLNFVFVSNWSETDASPEMRVSDLIF
jgi:hypothetical protein